MSSKIDCISCGFQNDWNGETEFSCKKCGTIITKVQTLLEPGLLDRIGIAAGYRRVGRFDDSQQELENILESYGDSPDVLFGCFLNSYEVTEYTFDKFTVKSCKCYSTAAKSVEKNRDWQDAQKRVESNKLKQWTALSQKVEELRKDNIRIKNNLPKYRAILICDDTNGDFKEKDAGSAARAIYDILSTKTDVFFPPVTLQNIKSDEEKEKYLMQVIKNPEIAPLMFVVYSDSFNYRNNKRGFLSNVARQCREFAKVHTKAELFSVTCDYEASHIMKPISIKTIRCKDFNSVSYDKIAKKILDNILISAYSDEEYEKFDRGEIIKLNEIKGLSPKICLIE